MNVYVFLHDTYADWELGYILPELRCPPDYPEIKKNVKNIKTFSLSNDSIQSMGGLNVIPDTKLESVNVDDISCLILPGGLFWHGFENAELASLIKELRKKVIPIGAICAATGYLGRIGLLDAVKHTSNSLEFLKYVAPDYQGSQYYQDELVYSDDHIITASGLGSIDFARCLLDELDVYEPPVLEVWYQAFKNGIDPTKSGAT